MTDGLRNDLEQLLLSPGWTWFMERVWREWGPQGDRFLPELKNALNLTDNDAAASQARQIVSAQAQILALLHAPQEEIARLSRVEQASVSVRVPLAPELAGQSRRGSL